VIPIRVSTTTVEQFRLVCTEDWASEPELIASIKGKPFEETEAMRFGKAWQHLLESAFIVMNPKDPERVLAAEFDFARQDVVRGRAMIPDGAVPEVKLVWPVVIDGRPVDVVAKVDAIHGAHVWENKTKLAGFSIGDYEPSLQWRFYLWAFGAVCCTYNVFSFHLDKQGVATFKDAQAFRFFPYPELKADCLRWLRDFVRWAGEKGLTRYLQREGTPT
jgi:hypothetical protein